MRNNQLLTQLQACAAVCNICYHTCLEEEHRAEMRLCIETNRDCADLCQLAASFLVRHSIHTDRLLALVAEVCDLCAAECARHEMDHCRRCAEVCRHTSNACREAHVIVH